MLWQKKCKRSAKQVQNKIKNSARKVQDEGKTTVKQGQDKGYTREKLKIKMAEQSTCINEIIFTKLNF